MSEPFDLAKDTAQGLQYALSEEQRARLARDFTYHAPKANQPERYVALRDGAHQLARAICMMTPPSREQSVALTHLETALFYANAAIARNE